MKKERGTHLTLDDGTKVSVVSHDEYNRHFVIEGEHSREQIDAMCDDFFSPGFPINLASGAWRRDFGRRI